MSEEIEFKNSKNSDNNIGVMDDIGVQMAKDQLIAHEKEIEACEEALVELEKDYNNYNDQWQIDKRLFELELEHFGKREEHITHKVELIPEFWELQKKKQEYRVRMETHNAEEHLKAIRKQQEALNKQLEIAHKNKVVIEQKLKEAEK